MNEVEKQIVQMAINILESQLKTAGDALTSPSEVKNFLRLNLELLEYEVFAVLFLDVKNRVIEYRQMFTGTIDGASVHPREVVKAALAANAASVIFAHNHPSGMTEPSRADKQLTTRLKAALELVDIRTLDHIIIGKREQTSFAEIGLL